MQYTIHRLVKRPGLIDRARTYFLELNDQGLYIIYLGKATQTPRRTLNPVTNAIADGAVNFFQDRYEKEIRATEEKMQTTGLDEMAKTKHSYFLFGPEVAKFEFSIAPDATTKIVIKGGKVNITLYTDPSYGRMAQSMKQQLGK